jgi:hypothetical protein
MHVEIQTDCRRGLLGLCARAGGLRAKRAIGIAQGARRAKPRYAAAGAQSCQTCIFPSIIAPLMQTPDL